MIDDASNERWLACLIARLILQQLHCWYLLLHCIRPALYGLLGTADDCEDFEKLERCISDLLADEMYLLPARSLVKPTV